MVNVYLFFSFIRCDKDKDNTKLLRFFGRCTLSISRAQKGTNYKYVIIKEGEVLWEQLVEFQSRCSGAIVDRFLSIPGKYLKRGGKLCFALLYSFLFD